MWWSGCSAADGVEAVAVEAARVALAVALGLYAALTLARAARRRAQEDAVRPRPLAPQKPAGLSPFAAELVPPSEAMHNGSFLEPAIAALAAQQKANSHRL